MLAALLLIPQPIVSSGHFYGYAPSATSWNPNWATEYGPDVDRAKKATREEVTTARKILTNAPTIEPISEVQELVKRSFVSELMKNEPDRIDVMTAYYAYRRWQKKRNERAAMMLLF